MLARTVPSMAVPTGKEVSPNGAKHAVVSRCNKQPYKLSDWE